MGTTRQTLHFGAFSADLAAAQLQKKGHRLKLQQQPFQVLAMLLERPGEVVSREELQKRLWPGDTFVDFDHGLNIAINKLREALGDSKDKPLFIETLPRIGYRFIAPVERGEDRSDSTPAEHGGIEPDFAPAIPAQPASLSRRATTRAAIAGIIVLAMAGLALTAWRGRTRKEAAPRIESLAVLPLANLSRDPDQEYFSDGMTDALITDLTRIGALKVISRTSVMQYKNTRERLPQIARELGVDAVVEGSVLRDGDQVRISIQLVDGRTDKHLWAANYQREYRSILALQSEVGRSIAENIKVTLTPQQQQHLTRAGSVDPEAHEAYLKGRYYLNERTAKELKKSIAYFEAAIERDSSYAPAYSGLADAYTLLSLNGDVPSRDALSRAKAAAQKAVQLDDTLAEAHASLAFIAETHEWDWPAAEREYKRALELNPSYATAHNWYAGYLMYLGRYGEGIAEAERARELDPLSIPINNALGGRLLLAGRYKEGVDQIYKTLDMDANYAPAYNRLGWAFLQQRRYEQAIAQFQKAVSLSRSDPDLLMDLGYAFGVAGKRGEAKRIFKELGRQRARGFVAPSALAIVAGAIGEKDEAFTWLEKAYEERDPQLTYLKVSPRFDPLRSDPRLAELMLRLRLPE